MKSDQLPPIDEQVVAAMRGRYCINGKRQDGKMLTAGKTQQYVEFRYDKKTNSLTTVQKDYIVVPYGYTACVSNTQRYKALGNGWTVDVLSHILKQFLRWEE